MKTISFAVPCYNSAAYMDTCIESILKCGDDIEILIVDDGSTKDDTAAKADAWQERHPGLIRAIHKENGGHGSAVNMGLANATGRYFKAVSYTHLWRGRSPRRRCTRKTAYSRSRT